MFQGSDLKDQMLKSYIEQIFNKYDKDNSGTLDVQEMTFFFNDLFRSLNINLTVTPQQAEEAIRSIDVNYDGKVDKNELYNAFKIMLNSPPSQPQQNTYQYNQPYQNYSNFHI